MRNTVALGRICLCICSKPDCLKIFFFPFEVQYVRGLLAFHGEESTPAGPSDSALTFHSPESFISFWPKISIDLGC